LLAVGESLPRPTRRRSRPDVMRRLWAPREAACAGALVWTPTPISFERRLGTHDCPGEHPSLNSVPWHKPRRNWTISIANSTVGSNTSALNVAVILTRCWPAQVGEKIGTPLSSMLNSSVRLEVGASSLSAWSAGSVTVHGVRQRPVACVAIR